MQKLARSLILILALQIPVTVFAADYVGVRVNAENYTSKSAEWYLTSPNSIPDVQPDPDGPHITDADNSAYMELLPDTRVTSQDELVSGGNYWGTPGGGPTLEYVVDIPEAGTYTVWVKLYATGTEDNGIHVGINGTTPASGERIQLCGGKNRWSWTSNQRTNDNHCGVTQTVSVEVPAAGSNTITFYAREDGFEIDQFLLLKENNPDVEDCYPLLSDRIRCVDVQTGAQIDDTDLPITLTTDGNTSNTGSGTSAQVDIAVDIGEEISTIEVGDSSTTTITVENLDLITASAVEVALDLPDSIVFVNNGNCTEANQTVTCQLGDILPGEAYSEDVQLTGIETGQYRIDVITSSELIDPVADNNSSSVQLTVVEATLAYDISINSVATPNVYAVNDTGRIDIVLSNEGTEVFPQSMLTLKYGNGALVSAPDLECSQTPEGITCSLPEINQRESLEYTLSIVAQSSGDLSVDVAVESNFDENQQNNKNTVALTVIDSQTLSADNGSLTIEAEDFHSQTNILNLNTPVWFRITDDTGDRPQPDTDDASAASAGGGAYMEILPDRRVADNEEPISAVTNFPVAGNGPSLTYEAFIPTSGRYYVNVLMRANGKQDNTLHVGYNNTWPESGSNLSLCNPTGAWAWASARETDGVCNNNTRPYLDIPSPGFYAIQLSQNEDGVEVDQLQLTLDETAIPTGIEQLSRIYTYPNIDLETQFMSLEKKGSTEEGMSLAIEVKNNDATHTAVDISLAIDGLRTLLDADLQADESCTRQNEQLICTIPSIAAGGSKLIELAFTPADSDQFEVTANVNSAHNDTSLINNLATTKLDIEATSGSGALSLVYLILLLLFAVLNRTRALTIFSRNQLKT